MIKLLERLTIYIFSVTGAFIQNIDSIGYYLRKALKGNVSKNFLLKDLTKPKVAILSCFQSSPSFSIEIQLRELRGRGFDIVTVSNAKVSPELLELYRAYSCVVINRPNIARDFGAYKAGYLFLLSNGYLENVSELLFINDTILFPVMDTNSFWNSIESSEFDIVAPFESFTPKYHLQSFFILCKNKIHLEKDFQAYWKTYFEWNSRRHAISAGEVGFSQKMIKSGFSLGALVSALSLNQLFERIDDVLLLLDIEQSLLIECYKEEDKKQIIHSAAEKSLAKLYETANPSHSLALLSVSLLQIPILKKDLVYRGTISLLELTRAHKTMELDIEVKELTKFYLEKGLPASHTLMDKFLMAINYK